MTMKATLLTHFKTKLPVIHAFNKCSEAGFNVFAPAIFISKCNLRCPYCMNSKLVLNQVEEVIDIESIEAYVKENNVDMLMISGGEPTAVPYDKLINLLEKIKSWDCRIGMSTNGLLSNKLKSIIHYLDYIALDMKGDDASYIKAGGSEQDFTEFIISKSFLTATRLERKDFKYEVRTTLYPPYINAKVLNDIGGLMHRDDIWVLQQFRHAKDMIDPSCKNIEPYSEKEIEKLAKIAKKYSNNVHVRYV